MGHIRVLAAGAGVSAALAALTACASPDDGAAGQDRCSVRSDPAPIERRFPAFGTPERVHWCGVVLNAGDGRVPGPTDVRLVGVVELAPAAFAGIVEDLGEDPVAQAPQGLPGEIVEFLPGEARWRRSDRLDRSVTQGRYTGSFHVDTAHRVVLVDCVDPVPPSTEPAP
ncbi:hypothetical protein [Streptomyces cellostaticus]|uniref:hypothetical protein n=1 Tax=Streptomyces cellostaticus TaxID=67285 RepID=UPI00202632AC|nr:hypothetical protein [Streptomyces cellostaticus]